MLWYDIYMCYYYNTLVITLWYLNYWNISSVNIWFLLLKVPYNTIIRYECNHSCSPTQIPNSQSVTTQMPNLRHSTSRTAQLQGLLFPTQRLLLLQLVPQWFVSLLQPFEAQRRATSVLFSAGGCRTGLCPAACRDQPGPQVTPTWNTWRSVKHTSITRGKHTDDKTVPSSQPC